MKKFIVILSALALVVAACSTNNDLKKANNTLVSEGFCPTDHIDSLFATEKYIYYKMMAAKIGNDKDTMWARSLKTMSESKDYGLDVSKTVKKCKEDAIAMINVAALYDIDAEIEMFANQMNGIEPYFVGFRCFAYRDSLQCKVILDPTAERILYYKKAE